MREGARMKLLGRVITRLECDCESECETDCEYAKQNAAEWCNSRDFPEFSHTRQSMPVMRSISGGSSNAPAPPFLRIGRCLESRQSGIHLLLSGSDQLRDVRCPETVA